MSLPQFVHLEPSSVQEACTMLSTYGEAAMILAGGTDLLVKMKQRRLVPRYVVNIKRVPDLGYIRYEAGKGIRIGALATIEELKNSPVVRRRYRILHQAASLMGTMEIRNRATLVGNVCNASPSAETVPALIALGARARVVGPKGERILPVEELLVGAGQTALGTGELVREIDIPEPAPGLGGAYEKHSLRRMDRAVVAVGVVLALDGGACVDARIVLNAVAPMAMRARKAEALLRGQVPSEEVIESVSWAAAEESRPRTGFHGTAEYKRNIVGILTRQVTKQALSNANLEVI
ncbi:MAG: xanthine dehydrogenase family protein subunit M [Chloroflexi bacterium]|nr:xanthine dehydrogenase family protein subunit M [Chloroflexota bacterium]